MAHPFCHAPKNVHSLSLSLYLSLCVLLTSAWEAHSLKASEVTKGTAQISPHSHERDSDLDRSMPTLGKSERGPFTLLPSVDIHRTDWLTMSIGDFVGCCHCKPKASKHHILRHTPELLGGRESCVQSSKTWCYGLVGLGLLEFGHSD